MKPNGNLDTQSIRGINEGHPTYTLCTHILFGQFTILNELKHTINFIYIERAQQSLLMTSSEKKCNSKRTVQPV